MVGYNGELVVMVVELTIGELVVVVVKEVIGKEVVQRAIAAVNSANFTGFVRYSSIPAAKQRSRSPPIAFAVIAMIGICRPVFRSDFRIAMVAS